MIRKFKYGDQFKLEANEFSDVDKVAYVFDDEDYQKYTLDDDGEVKCIIVWYEYMPRHYAIFFLMPDNVSFTNTKQLKIFMEDMALILKPKTCVTFSHDCGMLNRWHKFFGFEMQRKCLSDGCDGLNKWLIRKWA